MESMFDSQMSIYEFLDSLKEEQDRKREEMARDDYALQYLPVGSYWDTKLGRWIIPQGLPKKQQTQTWIGNQVVPKKEIVYYNLCTHHRSSVEIDGKIVLASASRDENKKNRHEARGKRKPDLSIYLDYSWIDYGDILGHGYHVYANGETPYIFVDWPDMKGIGLESLVRLEWIARKNITEGKRIEIGCLGGHGRTGTLLACILSDLEGMNDANEVVKEIRKRHCTKAVETATQVKLVGTFIEYMNEKKQIYGRS